jgi:hypothetical protein
MAFAAVADTSTSTQSGSTSHSIDLSTLNKTSGNLWVIAFSYDGPPENPVWAASYNEFFDVVSDSGVGLSIAWHEVTGGEGSSVTVTTDNAERSNHCIYEISGAEDPDTQPPEASAGATSPTADSNPDPDAVTPTGGAKDYLYIGVMAANDGTVAVTGFPANCPDSQISINDTQAGGTSCAMASDQLNQASFNPDAYTIASGEQWVACTVAVHPSTVVSQPGLPVPLMGIAQRRSTLLRMSPDYQKRGSLWLPGENLLRPNQDAATLI